MKLPPWYGTAEKIIAPTDHITILLLFAVIAITLLLILFGDAVSRAVWLVYLALP